MDFFYRARYRRLISILFTHLHTQLNLTLLFKHPLIPPRALFFVLSLRRYHVAAITDWEKRKRLRCLLTGLLMLEGFVVLLLSLSLSLSLSFSLPWRVDREAETDSRNLGLGIEDWELRIEDYDTNDFVKGFAAVGWWLGWLLWLLWMSMRLKEGEVKRGGKKRREMWNGEGGEGEGREGRCEGRCEMKGEKRR